MIIPNFYRLIFLCKVAKSTKLLPVIEIFANVIFFSIFSETRWSRETCHARDNTLKHGVWVPTGTGGFFFVVFTVRRGFNVKLITIYFCKKCPVLFRVAIL